MVGNITSFTNNGLRDWLWQRVSAVIFGSYVSYILWYFICHSPMTYEKWHSLHQCTSVKVFSILAVLSLVIHSWIGIWTVTTDYLKWWRVRLTVQLFVLIVLAAIVVWSIAVIWRI